MVGASRDASRQFTRISRLGALVLVFSVWLGSVWMFFIQPLVGKIVLPRFGGEVWTTAIDAFAIASCLGPLSAWLLSSLRQKRWAISGITAGFVLLFVFFQTDFQPQRPSLQAYL